MYLNLLIKEYNYIYISREIEDYFQASRRHLLPVRTSRVIQPLLFKSFFLLVKHETRVYRPITWFFDNPSTFRDRGNFIISPRCCRKKLIKERKQKGSFPSKEVHEKDSPVHAALRHYSRSGRLAVILGAHRNQRGYKRQYRTLSERLFISTHKVQSHFLPHGNVATTQLRPKWRRSYFGA